MRRHSRDRFFVPGEGILSSAGLDHPVTHPPSEDEDLREFRFSRLGPKGPRTDAALRTAIATAMTGAGAQPDSAAPAIPAGFTYLGQFVDHDLTMDRTRVDLGADVTVAELVQGRSPALDLDSVYGRGPGHHSDRRFYAADGIKLLVGSTAAVGGPGSGTDSDRVGFDLPRDGAAATVGERRLPLIPDQRNDENLALAQTHAAFIRFHNRVADDLAARGGAPADCFERARREVVLHYQWMLRTDFLPRVVEPDIVADVFGHGRRFVDPHGLRRPAMPIEFAMAAYRLGHSMVRGAYQWNRIFNSAGPAGIATLLQLFTFTGVDGNFTPHPGGTPVDDVLADLDTPGSGGALERLPSNWIVDFRRLYDFSGTGRADLVVPPGAGNVAKRIDTGVVDPLAHLPLGSFDGRGTNPAPIERNLAFRNLTRASMAELASGQQLAQRFGIRPLDPDVIVAPGTGADLGALPGPQRAALTAATPLWFYILREAEVANGRLTGVGGRIVTEVFHRAMQGSRISLLRNPAWLPRFGQGPDRAAFGMTDLLLFAFEGRADLLNPLGDAPPAQP